MGDGLSSDATGNVDVQEPLTKRKLKFTYGNHPDQLPMMDRNLGAMAGIYRSSSFGCREV